MVQGFSNGLAISIHKESELVAYTYQNYFKASNFYNFYFLSINTSFDLLYFISQFEVKMIHICYAFNAIL